MSMNLKNKKRAEKSIKTGQISCKIFLHEFKRLYFISDQWQKKVESERDWLMTNPWRHDPTEDSIKNSCDVNPVKNFSALDLD